MGYVESWVQPGLLALLVLVGLLASVLLVILELQALREIRVRGVYLGFKVIRARQAKRV